MTKANCIGVALFVTLACGGNPPDPAEPVPLQPPSEPEPKPMSNETAVGIEEPEDSAATIGEPTVGSEEKEKPLGNTVEETRTTEVIQEVVAKKRDTVRVCFDSL